jgi:tetratricopeptide (TPR) repeat protein
MATETGTDRIEIHDLLRAYADELLDESGERADAEVRLLEHYVRSLREAYGQFGRILMVDLKLPEPAPESIEHFSSAEDALAWYALERPVLFAALRRARALGLSRLCALIALDWRPMNQILDAASDSLDACRVAYEAARETSEPLLIAELARELGNKCSMLGLVDEARAHTLEALRIFHELDEPAGEANAYRNLSVGALRTGDIAGQIHYGEQAVTAARRSGRPDILSLSLYAHAQSIGQTNDLELEHELLTESLAQGRLAGPGFDIASAMVSLAWNTQLRGNFTEAQSWAKEASAQNESAFDVSIQVGMEAMLAYVGMKLGDLDEAASAVKRFDEMFEQHGSHAIQEWDSESIAEVQDYIEQARAWVEEQSTD